MQSRRNQPLFLQEVESLNKIITKESEKENLLVSVVIQAKRDLKKTM